MMTLFDEEQILKAYVKSEREVNQEEALKGVIEICYDLGLTISDTAVKIAAKYNLSEEEAQMKANQYWKY